MNQVFLGVAIVFEVLATSALKESHGFTRLWPSLLTIGGYALAFYFLSLPLRDIPVGIVYAVWSGLGIVLITAIGSFWFRQELDVPAIVGIAFIMTGVVIVNLFSKAVVH